MITKCVGNYRARPSNSSGTKVHIHVNQQIGSEKSDPDHCALRTGSWDGSTTLQVDVGGSGRILVVVEMVEMVQMELVEIRVVQVQVD